VTAQIDFSGTVQLSNSSSPVPQSYAHTGGALLALCMFGAGAGKRTVSSITFNGVAPDEILVSSANGSNAELTLHAVVWNNVSAVTANFVMTLSGGGVYGSCRLFSVTGHNTSDAVQASDDFFAGTTGTSYSNSLPSLTANTLVIDMIGVVGNRTSTIAEDSGQTEVGTPYFGGAFLTTASSYEVGTGVFALGWTWTTAENRNQILVGFNNAATNIDVDIDTAGAVSVAGQTVDAQIEITVNIGSMYIVGQDVTASIDGSISVSIDTAGAIGVSGQEVTASLNQAEVPDVVGETQANGTSDLEGAGFVVAVQSQYSGSVPSGEIISQDPIAGTIALTGTTVTIVVSIGDAPVFDGQTRDGRARGFLKPMYGRG
jgi:hypothetical protein